MPGRGDLRGAVLAALLFLLAIAALWPVLGNGFVEYDDEWYLLANPEVSRGLSWAGLRWAFTATAEANWHPLTWLSHQADVSLFGLDPRGHHLVGLLLHAANTGLLFLLLRRLTGALWPSAWCAALFAAHPLHVESVAWASERKDLLATLFWLLTLLAHLSYLRRRSPARAAAAVAAYALALLSKPMPVTLPFQLLLLDFWPLGRMRGGGGVRLARLGRLLREKTPYLLLAGGMSVLTFVVQREGQAMLAAQYTPLWLRAQNAVVAYAAYLGKTLWPAGLSYHYPFPRGGIPAWKVAAAALLLAGLSLAVARARRGHPYLAVGWLWYLGTLVPVIGLVRVGTHAMADRYTYVPLVGIFLAGAWGVSGLARRTRSAGAAATAAAAVLLLLAVLARRQALHWRDSLALFGHAVAVNPENSQAHLNLAFALERRGRAAEARAHYALAAQGLRRPPARR